MTKKSLLQKSRKSKHDLKGGVPIHTSKGRLIGQVRNGVFQKDIISKWILARPFPCIASDIYSLHEAERAGAGYVEFTCTDTGIVYRASIAKFWTLGKFINYVGEQQALGLEHYEQRRDPDFITSQTNALAYSATSDTNDIMPLHYVSRAPTGVTVNGVKQLGLFEGENE